MAATTILMSREEMEAEAVVPR